MKLLWGGDLKINTVHVTDVVRALWFLVSHGEVGKVYNLADKSNTGTPIVTPKSVNIIADQEKINTILEKIFGIKTGYKSSLTVQIATKVLQPSDSINVNLWSRFLWQW